MRPRSVTLFDRFFLGSLALGLINAGLSFQDNMAMLGGDPSLAGRGSGFLFTIVIFSLGIPLLLWFLISRRASNAAKWILVILTAFGLLSMLPSLPLLLERGVTTLAFTVAITVLQIIAIAFLFRNDARAWFARKGAVDPAASSIFE